MKAFPCALSPLDPQDLHVEKEKKGELKFLPSVSFLFVFKMGGGANLFVKDVIPWAHFNSGIFNGFGLLFFLSEKISKKVSQKSWPAQVPKLLPLGSPRDPEKANTE